MAHMQNIWVDAADNAVEIDDGEVEVSSCIINDGDIQLNGTSVLRVLNNDIATASLITIGSTAELITNVTPVVFFKGGELEVASGVFKYPITQRCRLIDVRLAVGTSPTGDDLIVDVHLNTGSNNIFTTQGNRPTVPDGDSDGIGVPAFPDVWALSAGDYLTIDVDQIGSTTPGSNLQVALRMLF